MKKKPVIFFRVWLFTNNNARATSLVFPITYQSTLQDVGPVFAQKPIWNQLGIKSYK